MQQCEDGGRDEQSHNTAMPAPVELRSRATSWPSRMPRNSVSSRTPAAAYASSNPGASRAVSKSGVANLAARIAPVGPRAMHWASAQTSSPPRSPGGIASQRRPICHADRRLMRRNPPTTTTHWMTSASSRGVIHVGTPSCISSRIGQLEVVQKSVVPTRARTKPSSVTVPAGRSYRAIMEPGGWRWRC